jgi:hypothetical protein
MSPEGQPRIFVGGMHSLRPAGLVFLGALLASAGVHLPVYAILGALAGTAQESRAGLPPRGVPFELADVAREDRPEYRAHPSEPERTESPEPPDRPRMRWMRERAARPSARPDPMPDSMEPEAGGASTAGRVSDEKAAGVPLEGTAEDGSLAVATTRAASAPGPSTGRLSNRAAGYGSQAGQSRGRATGADQPAIPLIRVEPVYPLEAARDGVQGWVR